MIKVFTPIEKPSNFDSPFKGRKPISFLSNYNEPISLNGNEEPMKISELKQPLSYSWGAQNKAMLAKKLTKRHTKALPTVNHLQKLKTMFKKMVEASYKSPEQAADIGKQYALVFDNQLSNKNTYVFLDTETGFPLITHRGSTTAIDWFVSDPLILTGAARVVMPRVTTAREIVKNVEEKYKRPSDSFSHSLGGYIAEESGASGMVLTYNKAAGLGDIRKKINPNQIDYRSYKDIVSILAETQDTNIKYITNDKGLLYSHSTDILPSVQERRL